MRTKRELAKSALGRIRKVKPNSIEIRPELTEYFGRQRRENVSSGESPFREAWLQAIADCVEVGADMIRIVGDRESLENTLNGSGGKAVPALAVLYGNGAPHRVMMRTTSTQ